MEGWNKWKNWNFVWLCNVNFINKYSISFWVFCGILYWNRYRWMGLKCG